MTPNITINVTASTPEAAQALLAGLAGLTGGQAPSVAMQGAAVVPQALVNPISAATPPAPATTPSPAAPAPTMAPASDAAPAPAAAYEMADVRAELKRVGNTEARKILAEFGAEKLSAIPADQYPAVIARAQEVST